MSGHETISVRTTTAAFAALLLLIGATVGVAFLDLGRLNLVLALGIACVKTLLVLAIFMHLWHSRQLRWFVAATGFAFLALLIGTLILDFSHR